MISVGFEDLNVHESYICRIKGKSGNGEDVAVNGLLSEGYNIQSTSNYGQPMLDFTAGQKIGGVGAVAQGMTNMTSQTLSNSIQVYENETPIMQTLPLSFIALRDPLTQVSLPERYLLEMKAPRLVAGALMGAQGMGARGVRSLDDAKSVIADIWESIKNSRRPQFASVTISRHIMFPECLITDVEIQDESINHQSGLAMQKTINVTIAFQRAYNNAEFAALFQY